MTEVEQLLAEALNEYVEHQSWRCEYPPHYYYADGPPEGGYEGCPCGLDDFRRRAKAAMESCGLRGT